MSEFVLFSPGYLEGPPRRVATLANLNFYKPLAEKALTYYNSKECTNLLLKEVLVADRQHQPETVVWMNFIARSEDDSKLFYFFANLQDGPYPNYHDVKEMCFEEDFKEPQPSDFQVKELCSLETHDSDYSQSIASRAWGYKVVYPQGASHTFGKSCSPSIYHLAKASRKIEINSLFFSDKKALLMATMDPDGGDVVHASSPQKKLKSIPCLDYPGDYYIDRDQIVDEEEESDTPGYLEGPPRRVATLANLNFYKPLAEKALTYYNSKEFSFEY
ncbi:uncharacterized protein LOC130805307 isoform X4 [Amaranthus tricolor]|uniref:uncharacterized protein LOC130805307 isoform X4 n=1 Tax=Amaranthus tricolor TaxID=29722 RepID=UPI002588EAC0|nr:uncharacterized protein LOC130805307 isoform X4 [Amaranthus tricolor]XP_057525994.1 uncharacterized protein LOC130805307 isoform X4 [Amaranthus tricolor]XP_057525995.1 uncharacterized protein LOC130805307 isoform X4 [Amaranthus tricolor]XP_057525996.1 uncharacterized protein LOC130805307 isoform X4 [Amaranthus tricolor]